jgi:hypothetical protein
MHQRKPLVYSGRYYRVKTSVMPGIGEVVPFINAPYAKSIGEFKGFVLGKIWDQPLPMVEWGWIYTMDEPGKSYMPGACHTYQEAWANIVHLYGEETLDPSTWEHWEAEAREQAGDALAALEAQYPGTAAKPVENRED